MVLEHLSIILSVNETVWFIVACLVALCAYLVNIMLDSRAMGVVSAPFLLYGALEGNYLFRASGTYLTGDKEADVVAAVGGGLVIALLTFVVVSRLLGFVWGWRVKMASDHLASAGSHETAGR